MAIIYEMSTGTIMSENSGITTIENHVELPEHNIALQQVQQAATQAEHFPCDAYMTLIKELLKDL